MRKRPSIADLVELPDGVERTAGLVEWFQSLFAGESVPVLVGGAAVELYTAGAYTTGDLDFAGHLTPAVERRLRQEGFEKLGRSWRLGEEVFLELPAAALSPGSRAVTLSVAGRSVLVIGVEDLVVDRLAAWKHWRSEVDAVNALSLWDRHRVGIDRSRLAELAAGQGLADALSSLLAFAERHLDAPPREEIERWARQTFR